MATPAIRTDVYTPAAGNAQSAAVDAACNFVRIHNDGTGAVKIAIGANPNATVATEGFRMGANATETFGIPPGHKIAYATSA